MPTHTRSPQPPLPPTPPATASSSPSAAHHRRQRTFSSSSSSSSSSLSTASSAASSPSPSPRSRGAATRSATSVPFSWEHHPGIPKTRLPADAASSQPPPLPLPPPLRAPPSAAARRGHRRRASPSVPAAADPFAAALAECTRERSSSARSDAGLMDSLFPASPAVPSRRWSLAASTGGFLDLHGCKSAMAVAEGAFLVRRPVAVARPGHGRAGQLGRPGRAARR